MPTRPNSSPSGLRVARVDRHLAGPGDARDMDRSSGARSVHAAVIDTDRRPTRGSPHRPLCWSRRERAAVDRDLGGSLPAGGTDYIDLYQLHAFDALTPHRGDAGHAGRPGAGRQDPLHRLLELLGLAPDEVAGRSEKYGLARYVAHQAYYSLVGRDYEWELMPLALDQKVGTVVWSPLGWGRLTGKIRRGQPLPQTSRLQSKSRPTWGRRSPTSISTRSSMRSTRSRGRPARPCRRSRSTGCCSGRPWPTSSSARATRSSCGRTWARWAGTSRPRRWPARRRQRARPPYPYWHQRGFERNPFPTGPWARTRRRDSVRVVPAGRHAAHSGVSTRSSGSQSLREEK